MSFMYYLFEIVFFAVLVKVLVSVMGSLGEVFQGKYVKKELEHPKSKSEAPWNYWRPMKIINYKVVGNIIKGKIVCPDGNVYTVEARLPKGEEPKSFLSNYDWCYCVADVSGYLHCEAVKHAQPPSSKEVM